MLRAVNEARVATAEAVIYTTPPQAISTANSLSYSLGYNFDTEPTKLYQTTADFPQSTADMIFTDAVDLSRFKGRGGKMMIYQGGSDSSVSVKDILRWYDAMNVQMGSKAQDFAPMYVVPGMAHGSGGPATDSFDMLPQLVEWVEKGIAPDSVVASATNPGYFRVSSRTRPLCAYPKQTRYKGPGDINDAASFTCQWLCGSQGDSYDDARCTMVGSPERIEAFSVFLLCYVADRFRAADLDRPEAA